MRVETRLLTRGVFFLYIDKEKYVLYIGRRDGCQKASYKRLHKINM